MIRYTKQVCYIIAIILLASSKSLFPLGQFNWLRPYDTLLRPDQKICEGMQLNFYGEFGVKPGTGYDLCSQPVNPLQILSPTQDALAMLNGFPADSPITELSDLINATDDGIRGNFVTTGKFNMNWTFAITGRYFFHENICLSAYLPFYGVSLTNVNWNDLTQDVSAEDVTVKELLTSKIFTVAENFGCLNLCNWDRKGAGDTLVWVEFFKDFKQNERPMLKEVDLNGRIGFNLPTGKRQDENLVMAVPFGYDGAYGIIGGAGIDVQLADVMQLGLDVELLHLFGNTRDRRIKTDVNQTELLLLAKVPTYRDWGLYQRFNLYAQVYNMWGASLKLGYQFFKHDSDTISFSTCTYSTNVANTATSLQEWVMHHIYVVGDYDFSEWFSLKDHHAVPYLSAYARIPFKGKNITLVPVIGANISINF